MVKTVRRKPPRGKWSAKINSNALDLETRVFAQRDPRRIARSLKTSAERSKRRKTTPFQSAMSMLNFYINRAGRQLSSAQKRRLDRAKGALRELFHKE